MTPAADAADRERRARALARRRGAAAVQRGAVAGLCPFLDAEVVVLLVVSSATAAATGHLQLAVALEALESDLAVRVLIAIALTFTTRFARRAAGSAFVDESACSLHQHRVPLSTILYGEKGY